MASILNKYNQHLQALKELQDALSELEGSTELQKEREFVDALKGLQEEYSVSNLQALKILGVVPTDQPSDQSVKKRKGSPVWKYTNPFTGETVVASRANNKVVRAWTAQHGEEVVRNWRELLGPTL